MEYCTSLNNMTIFLNCSTLNFDMVTNRWALASEQELSSEEASTLETFTDSVLPHIPKTVSHLTVSFPIGPTTRRTSLLLEKWLAAGDQSRVEKKMLELTALEEVNIVIAMGEPVPDALQRQMASDAFPALHRAGKLRFPSNHVVEWQARLIKVKAEADEVWSVSDSSSDGAQ